MEPANVTKQHSRNSLFHDKVTFMVHLQKAITHNSVKIKHDHILIRGQKPQHHIPKITIRLEVTAKHKDSFLHDYIGHLRLFHREVNPCLPGGLH
jgi:hypothetical protein